MSLTSLRPETTRLTDVAVNCSSGPAREKSRRGTDHTALEDLRLSHTCRIFTCVPHTVSIATGRGAKMLPWYLHEGEKRASAPRSSFSQRPGLFPSSRWLRDFSQQPFGTKLSGSREPVNQRNRHYDGRASSGPSPGNSAQRQEGICY